MNKLKRLLIFIRVILVCNNTCRVPKLGKGYHYAYKVNPYNPISYVVLLAALLAGLVLTGFVGVYGAIKENGNPFKWN